MNKANLSHADSAKLAIQVLSVEPGGHFLRPASEAQPAQSGCEQRAVHAVLRQRPQHLIWSGGRT